ncbi:MAG TPA: lytic transglycosylase domain-containing protein [Pyrinomonadaceae bacterium]|jgi:soluble lytic murein transglycosylase-like protein
MKKICLAVVLSIVSVFSISAQTGNKSAANITVINNAAETVRTEPESPKIEAEPLKTIEKTPKTDVPEVKNAPAAETQKPETTETVKNPAAVLAVKTSQFAEAPKPRAAEPSNEAGLPVSALNKASLEGLSTGNPAVDGYIEEFSTLYNVDPRLIYAQMSQESSFNARATSGKGASGFMQLMPDTARRFGVTNIYNPKQNIKAGVKYMRWLLDKFGGDTRLALAGYNAGEGAVLKYGNKVPPYRETQNYVAKIMSHYDLLSNGNLTVAILEDRSATRGANLP